MRRAEEAIRQQVLGLVEPRRPLHGQARMFAPADLVVLRSQELFISNVPRLAAFDLGEDAAWPVQFDRVRRPQPLSSVPSARAGKRRLVCNTSRGLVASKACGAFDPGVSRPGIPLALTARRGGPRP